MPDWEAAYLDGRTAARRRAGVHITRTGLDVSLPDSGTRFFWPFREIRQTQGTYAGEQVRLERGGELAEALLIGDIGFLSAARAGASVSASPSARCWPPSRWPSASTTSPSRPSRGWPRPACPWRGKKSSAP